MSESQSQQSREKSNCRSGHAIMIAPGWPGEDGGYPLAIRAALILYLEKFESISFIGLTENPFEYASQWPDSRVQWLHVPIDNLSPAARFLTSLLSFWPAILMRAWRTRKVVLNLIDSVLKQYPETGHVILEDIPLLCFCQPIRIKFPSLEIAMHSHNETEMAFEPMKHHGGIVNRLAWTIEWYKIRRVEKKLPDMVDALWTISQDDADAYKSRLGVCVDGVIGLCMNTERYMSISGGDPRTVVYIGSTDLRKRHTLDRFIKEIWPLIRKSVPDARLVFAGKGTADFSDDTQGIEGLGFCEDERTVLARGRVFINPQLFGSGVQLKSIVALLAARALVCTQMGIEGVAGQNEQHYLSVADFADFSGKIIYLFQNSDEATRLGNDARAMASERYSQSAFLKETLPLLDAWIARQ